MCKSAGNSGGKGDRCQSRYEDILPKWETSKGCCSSKVLYSKCLGYLSVTLKDHSVFSKDTFVEDGTGVGGSGVLDKEEIMKLLEEEERDEVEWQDGGNFTDQ
ncbi:hypothetical protein Tco_1335188 [Tanacetum coccineum]